MKRQRCVKTLPSNNFCDAGVNYFACKEGSTEYYANAGPLVGRYDVTTVYYIHVQQAHHSSWKKLGPHCTHFLLRLLVLLVVAYYIT